MAVKPSVSQYKRQLSPGVWLRKCLKSCFSDLPCASEKFSLCWWHSILLLRKRSLKIDPLSARNNSSVSVTPNLSSCLTSDWTAIIRPGSRNLNLLSHPHNSSTYKCITIKSITCGARYGGTYLQYQDLEGWGHPRLPKKSRGQLELYVWRSYLQNF